MGDDLQAKIGVWLTEEGLSPSEQPDARAEFHYLVRYPPGKNGHAFNIVQPKSRKLIAISSLTRVDGGQQKEMKSHADADLEGWQDWMHTTRTSLIASGVDWGIHVGGDKALGNGPLQAFNVSEPIWLDGLSKNALMQGLRKLWLAKLGIIHEIKHFYGPGTGKPGPVDDFKDRGKSKPPTKTNSPPKQVETDDSGTFGAGFDPSEWI
jgi:hypothetical protein